MELSETNHNTMTGYTHMARVALNFGGGGSFGAVQCMDLQLSPTTPSPFPSPNALTSAFVARWRFFDGAQAIS